jgi:anti-anti-sigma factor
MNSTDDTNRNGQSVGSREPASGVREITLFGDYDLSRKDEVAKLFGSLDGVQPLVINFSKVTFLDSTVLALLAQLRLRSVGRQIILSDASDQIRRLFRLVGFEKIFEITKST